MVNHETDVQAKTLYDAERKVDWSKYGGYENLKELETVWVYVDKLMARKSFERRYPRTHGKFNRTHRGWKSKPQRYVEWGKPYVVGNSYGKLHGITIKPSSYGGKASGTTIYLDKWARQKYIVVHELAHVVDRNENGAPNKPWHQGHGWQFCLIYLKLVELAFGHDAKKELRDSFRNEGVRFNRPKGARNQCPWDPNPNREWVTGE